MNKESAARLAKQNADQAVVAAQTSQDAAVAALTQAQQTFGAQQTSWTDSRPNGPPPRPSSTRPASGRRRRPARLRPHPPQHPPRQPGGRHARPTGIAHPARPRRQAPTGTAGGTRRCRRSPAPSSAVTRSRSSTRCSASRPRRRRLTQQMGRNFLQKLGILPTPTGYTNGAIPRVYGQAGLGVRHPARGLADGRALLVGWR